jgi:Fe2+ transport system protein FeoA
MHDLVPLSALRKGEVADIHDLAGAPERIRRLEELGLRAGVRLEMVQSGSPCIVRINGTKLCLRDGELTSVIVRPRKSA